MEATEKPSEQEDKLRRNSSNQWMNKGRERDEMNMDEHMGHEQRTDHRLQGL